MDLDSGLVERARAGNWCREGEVTFLALDLLGPKEQVSSRSVGGASCSCPGA